MRAGNPALVIVTGGPTKLPACRCLRHRSYSRDLDKLAACRTCDAGRIPRDLDKLAACRTCATGRIRGTSTSWQLVGPAPRRLEIQSHERAPSMPAQVLQKYFKSTSKNAGTRALPGNKHPRLGNKVSAMA